MIKANNPIKDFLPVFESCGCISTGHFVYASGMHGDVYVNKATLYKNPTLLAELSDAIVHAFKDERIEVIVGPAVGAAILSQTVGAAFHRAGMSDVEAIYADKDGDSFALKRGYDKAVEGKRVLMVEDIMNAGSSLKKAIDIVKNAGGNIVGAGVLCNRGEVTSSDLGIEKLFALVTMQGLAMYEKSECPLCKENVPINTNLGHGS